MAFTSTIRWIGVLGQVNPQGRRMECKGSTKGVGVLGHVKSQDRYVELGCAAFRVLGGSGRWSNTLHHASACYSTSTL